MNIVIREAAESDSKAICCISKNDLGYDCSETLVKRKINALNANREKVFVAEIEGAVAGYIHIEKYDCLYCPTGANLLALAICAEYRKNGVGTALAEKAENYAKAAGASWIRVNSGESRKSAHDFYRKRGYNNEKKQIRFFMYV